jgi:hypothetical protein
MSKVASRASLQDLESSEAHKAAVAAAQQAAARLEQQALRAKRQKRRGFLCFAACFRPRRHSASDDGEPRELQMQDLGAARAPSGQQELELKKLAAQEEKACRREQERREKEERARAREEEQQRKAALKEKEREARRASKAQQQVGRLRSGRAPARAALRCARTAPSQAPAAGRRRRQHGCARRPCLRAGGWPPLLPADARHCGAPQPGRRQRSVRACHGRARWYVAGRRHRRQQAGAGAQPAVAGGAAAGAPQPVHRTWWAASAGWP